MDKLLSVDNIYECVEEHNQTSANTICNFCPPPQVSVKCYFTDDKLRTISVDRNRRCTKLPSMWMVAAANNNKKKQRMMSAEAWVSLNAIGNLWTVFFSSIRR